MAMKTNTHPVYFADAQVVCACGNVMTIGSTQQKIHVELCSKCHPFYTGAQKFVDSANRIDKFKKKQKLQVQSHSQKCSQPSNSNSISCHWFDQNPSYEIPLSNCNQTNIKKL